MDAIIPIGQIPRSKISGSNCEHISKAFNTNSHQQTMRIYIKISPSSL